MSVIVLVLQYYKFGESRRKYWARHWQTITRLVARKSGFGLCREAEIIVSGLYTVINNVMTRWLLNGHYLKQEIYCFSNPINALIDKTAPKHKQSKQNEKIKSWKNPKY